MRESEGAGSGRGPAFAIVGAASADWLGSGETRGPTATIPERGSLLAAEAGERAGAIPFASKRVRP